MRIILLILLLSFLPGVAAASSFPVLTAKAEPLAALENFAQENRGFFIEQETRAELLGVLDSCQDTMLVDDLDRQSVVGHDIEVYFSDKSKFPSLSGDDIKLNTAFVMSFMKGYSFGTKLAIGIFAKNVKPEEQARICSEARAKAKEELKKPAQTHVTKFQENFEIIKPAINEIIIKHEHQAFIFTWLNKCNQKKVAADYEAAVSLEKSISDMFAADETYKQYTPEELRDYMYLSAMFLSGTAHGKFTRYLENTPTPDSVNKVCVGILKQAYSFIDAKKH